ncbi:hypothetical protein [Streptomyces mirabilis]|uniref:hypothetical protein n=1 Tax=Streptomyces mirabilis TaxID=68239 RepID=UPI0036AEB129
MKIPMPDETLIPDGPYRRLLTALHQLHEAAGWPGLQRTSKAIRVRHDLPDTISHEAISKILRGKVVPQQWHKLESLIRQYLTWSIHRPDDLDAEVLRIHQLWQYAVTGQDDRGEEHPPAETSSRTSTPADAEPAAQDSSGQDLLPPEDVVRQAAVMPREEASDFISDQALRPDRDLLPLIVLLMENIPSEGIRLLHHAGISHDAADNERLADFAAAIQEYPASAWYGEEPLHALFRPLFGRTDYGIGLVKLLLKRQNAAALNAYFEIAARRTDPGTAADFTVELAKRRAAPSAVDDFLTAVAGQMPRSLARELAVELRRRRRQQEAHRLNELLAAAPEKEHPPALR